MSKIIPKCPVRVLTTRSCKISREVLARSRFLDLRDPDVLARERFRTGGSDTRVSKFAAAAAPRSVAVSRRLSYRPGRHVRRGRHEKGVIIKKSSAETIGKIRPRAGELAKLSMFWGAGSAHAVRRRNRAAAIAV